MKKKNTNRIGLDTKQSAKVAAGLNSLLADFHIYYQNLRGLHWNIRGKHFFELHVKFEELYNDALLKIDLVAERILTLGNTPLHSFSDYLKASTVKEKKNVMDAKQAVGLVLDNLKIIVALERSILPEAVKLGDEGTISMLTDFITEQEKTIWMYASWMD
jgi:starvation-inducible DNA-binding protein